MRRACLVAALSLGLAAPAAAQLTDAGVTYGPWLLDGGTGTVDATVRPSFAAHVAIGAPVLAVAWAPEDDFDPGVTAVTLGLRRSFVDGNTGALFGEIGAGVVHIAAGNQEAALGECTPENGCMFEGVDYESGWGPAAGAGLGADLRIFRQLHLELSAGLFANRVDELRVFARSALGFAWRPGSR